MICQNRFYYEPEFLGDVFSISLLKYIKKSTVVIVNYIFFSFKDVLLTTCIGGNHTGGTTRTAYENCNIEPCPVWTNWSPLSGDQCSVTCGGGTIEERSYCVVADETPVATCDGKIIAKYMQWCNWFTKVIKMMITPQSKLEELKIFN